MAVDVLIVADDLTGALDAAAPFAPTGKVAVARRPAALLAAAGTGAQVVAVATATREGPAAAAAAAIAALAEAVATLRPGQILKKVDSRLKGHVAVETGALAALMGARRVVACPAIPELGRRCEGGRVVGAGVVMPIPVAPAFETGGLPVVAADARSAAELDAIVATAGPLDLLAGARGLAAALARARPGTARRAGPWPAGPRLLAIGSRDPVTLAQVAALDGAVPGIEAQDGDLDVALARRFLVEGGCALARMTGAGRDPGAGMRFAARVAELAQDVGVIFACGGETADAVLGAAGFDVLEVVGELSPGVPRARALRLGGSLGKSVEVVTKSGGFGEPDLLARVWQMMSAGSPAAGRVAG